MIFCAATKSAPTSPRAFSSITARNRLRVLEENPYRLAMDVAGIGFLTADKIAGKLGFAPDSPLRAEAGLFYALQQAADDGHVCTPYRG